MEASLCNPHSVALSQLTLRLCRDREDRSVRCMHLERVTRDHECEEDCVLHKSILPVLIKGVTAFMDDVT